MNQLIGSHIISADGYDTTNVETIHDISDSFRSGMGTPFSQFSDLALISNASGTYLDDHLEVDIFTLINLDDDGSMLGSSLTYSIIENLVFELSVSQYWGNEDPYNQFTLLEDFSHLRLGLKYSF